MNDPQVVAAHSHRHFMPRVGGASCGPVHKCALGAIKHVQVHGDGRECRPCELTAWQKIRRKIAVRKLRVMCIGDDIGHRRHHVAELSGFIDLVPHMCSPAQERG